MEVDQENGAAKQQLMGLVKLLIKTQNSVFTENKKYGMLFTQNIDKKLTINAMI
ncbi:MAG: hypothetical protein PUG60_15145 [Lachnospiraceae bacterium]|nr:hypothetical protein [Lachnospiraceae bacterium]MDY4969136.1 hypothetical protein [Lachnospiraceae bacterium]